MPEFFNVLPPEQALRVLLDRLQDPDFRRDVDGLGGYDTGEMGKVVAAAYSQLQNVMLANSKLIPQRLPPITSLFAIFFGRADYGPKVS